MIEAQTSSRISLNGRENNFDFLRFFFASLVIFGHSFHLLGLYQDEWITRATRQQLYSGSLAVYSFFFISGFLISQSWERSKGAFNYFKKRAQRIYPGFIVVCLLCAFLFAPLGAENIPLYWHEFSLRKFVFYLLFLGEPQLPAVFTHQTVAAVNGSLWTIQHEFLCYILVAILGLAGLLRGRWIVTGLFALFCGLHVVNLSHHPSLLHSAYLPKLGTTLDPLPTLWAYFLGGSVCAVWQDRLLLTNRTAVIAGIVVLISSLAPPLLLFTLPLCLPVLLLWLAYSPRIRLHRWTAKTGDMSYGIYLYAFPIQQVLIKYAPPAQNPYALAVLTLPLTIGAAALSWHCVESPFLRKKRAAVVPTQEPLQGL